MTTYTVSPTCIVCGGKRTRDGSRHKHDAEEHRRIRRERAATCNLKRKTFPRLHGAGYPDPKPPARPDEWACIVQRGQVYHVTASRYAEERGAS
jgi:hypothetical protein